MKIDLKKSVEPIIREAGKIILSYFNKPLTKFQKDGGTSYATEADLASERYLIESLKAVMPEASFFAEESGKSGDSDYCWVIDPLDGTTNFAHGFNYFCISIALTHKDTPVFGMVYDPLRDELFYAQEGQGAYLNEKKIAVTSPTLEESLVLVSLPYDKDDRMACDIMVNVRHDARAVRQMGSAVLDQMNVACGRSDALFSAGLGWWDITAGRVILQEAGAKVTQFDGSTPGPSYKTYIAASEDLYNKLLPYLR